MKNFIKITLNVLIVCLFTSCNHNSQKEELNHLNAMLSSMVTEQYEYIKFIDSDEGMRRYNIDSVYFRGNRIIENIDSPNFKEGFKAFFYEYQEEFKNFYDKYPDKLFEIRNWNDKEYLEAIVRITQLQELQVNIRCFFGSYFQVDELGLAPSKREVQKNKAETIELIPLYLYRVQEPIVIINSDTLEIYKNQGRSYLFNCFFTEAGEHLIEPEIIVRRWGETRKYKVGFIINVK